MIAAWLVSGGRVRERGCAPASVCYRARPALACIIGARLVDGGDDLLGVDPLQVGAGGGQVRVT
ncbi:MAG: hypothetical protein ACXVGQ_14465, partial [Mycobacteriaceae bacterium]